jgi:hypothetical protein
LRRKTGALPHYMIDSLGTQSRHTHMLPSLILNLFRWALTPQCPEIILETVVISFLSVLHSSNHGLRETLGKMECESLPVSATSQPFCHSSNILCFAIGSKSRAIDCVFYTILPKVPCFASKSACNSNMCRYPHETHFTTTSSQLPVANIFVYTRTRTDGYAARFSVILLPSSSSYCQLRSSTFPVPHFLYGP